MNRHCIAAFFLALFVFGAMSQPCQAARDNAPAKQKQEKMKPLMQLDLRKLWKEAKSISREKVDTRAKRYMMLICTIAERNELGITWNELEKTREDMLSEQQMELVLLGCRYIFNGAEAKNANLPVLLEENLSEALSKELKVSRRTVVLFNSKGKILKVADLDMLRDWQQCLKGSKEGTPTSDNKKQKPVSKLSKIVNKLIYQTKKRPNLNAENYVFLISHRTCGICCAEMPNVVREYENMRKDNRLEIILLAGFSPLDAKFYAERYQVPFPVCHGGTPELGEQFEEMRQAAGKENMRISAPHAIFMTADGKLLQEGPAGQLIPQWETIIGEAK